MSVPAIMFAVGGVIVGLFILSALVAMVIVAFREGGWKFGSVVSAVTIGLLSFVIGALLMAVGG